MVKEKTAWQPPGLKDVVEEFLEMKREHKLKIATDTAKSDNSLVSSRCIPIVAFVAAAMAVIGLFVARRFSRAKQAQKEK